MERKAVLTRLSVVTIVFDDPQSSYLILPELIQIPKEFA